MEGKMEKEVKRGKLTRAIQILTISSCIWEYFIYMSICLMPHCCSVLSLMHTLQKLAHAINRDFLSFKN